MSRENEMLYKGRKIALLTKHKKETVIQPLFEQETGCIIIVETRYDTDKLGTFSREIKRRRSQLDTARQKIEYGMKIAKTDIGIASEGSFGMHPYISIPWNIEIVVLFDQKENVLIYGVYESNETNLSNILTEKYDDALVFAEKIGFPKHYIIIRPDNSQSKKIVKGINDFDSLLKTFNWCKSKSRTGKVFLETDMRAFANPTRMNNIKHATQNLIENIKKKCPKCGSPGFITHEKVKGLPCKKCNKPSELILKNVCRCPRCKYIKEIMYPEGQYASPENCHYCNP